MARPDVRPPDLKGFTFVSKLGSGGFSDVYLYDQHLPHRRVAVKVLLTEGLTAASQDAFVREANTMAQLSHPYIVKIYQADVSDDQRPYIVMEYLPGETLADKYKRRPLTVVEALRTGVRLASAIEMAHAAKVRHGDIKPANVLTNQYGHPILTDFGISSALEDDLPSLTTTRDGRARGENATGSESIGMSVPWSPAEMFEENPKPDFRTDVFSLAATIYTVLAGRTPFEVSGKSNRVNDLMNRIERGEITPMERTDVPASLLRVLRKGMATRREDRYSTAVDFARALNVVELELNYAPTQIEVAGLDIPAPESRAEDNREDATRARTFARIEAQAPVVVPPAGGRAETIGRETSAVLDDQTQLRELRIPADDATGRAIDETARPKRTGLVLGITGGLILAAVLGVVGVNAIGLAKGPGPAQPDAAVDSGSPITLPEVIPTPVLVVASSVPERPTEVEFDWFNPSPATGDSYVWQRTDGAADQEKVPTTDRNATVSDVSPGTKVCINVWVLRSGQVSATPLSACYP